MDKWRTVVTIVVIGIVSEFVDAGFDGHWPSWSPMHWVVLIGVWSFFALAYLFVKWRMSQRSDEND